MTTVMDEDERGEVEFHLRRLARKEITTAKFSILSTQSPFTDLLISWFMYTLKPQMARELHEEYKATISSHPHSSSLSLDRDAFLASRDLLLSAHDMTQRLQF